MADYYCEGRLWEQLYAFVREEQIKLSPGTNNLAIYHNGGTTEDGVDIEVGVMVEREGADKGGFCYRETEAAVSYTHLDVYKRQTKHYDMWVKEAVKAGADIIISGAGLPVSLPEYVEAAYAEMEKKPDRRIKLAPIVSSAKSAMVICKMWDRKCHIAPDLVVVEGPLAGGHLGFSLDQLSAYGADTSDVPATYDREAYDREVKAVIKVVEEYGAKYGRHIPVVTAGGIYTHEDVMHQLELGADGVQVATRFVTTQECDASDAYKQAYINAGKEDIVITQSPVGMPGRAILNPFLSQIKGGTRPAIKSCFQCLEHCDIRTIPYCITMALVYAAEGDTDHGLLFCGSNAYRAEKIDTVDNVMKELTGELA